MSTSSEQADLEVAGTVPAVEPVYQGHLAATQAMKVFLAPWQHEALKITSAQRGVSQRELVRQAIMTVCDMGQDQLTIPTSPATRAGITRAATSMQVSESAWLTMTITSALLDELGRSWDMPTIK